MDNKPINIKVNRTNSKQNHIILPARFGSITTNVFIYASSLKKIYKLANEYATEISSQLNVGVDPIKLIQCLEVGATAFILKHYGCIAEMQMSKALVTFYNVVACALLDEKEYAEYEISFDSEEEFIKLVA